MGNIFNRPIQGGALDPVFVANNTDNPVPIDGAVDGAAGVFPVSFSDSPAIDAFGRLRVSNPETIFDSKNIFDDDGLAANVENQPLFFDNQETAGGGTATAYNANESSQTISVSNAVAGTRVRQTRMRFNYQPGKSQLVFLTFNLNGGNAGIVKRYGFFDAQNGLFLEMNATVPRLVRRTYVTGAAVDNAVAQANWNIDPLNGSGASGINLDFTDTQILVIDFEWLGVGRVRMGFVINGLVYYAHEFLNTNALAVVYMQTPNLPVRAEITNDGSGGDDSLDCICSSVISEGGSEDLGVMRYASTEGTHLDANVENTVYVLLAIRLKAEYLGAAIKLLGASIQIHTASDRVEWKLVWNPTVAGALAFADQTNSAIQVARGATANTVTGGIDMDGGHVESGSVSGGSSGSINVDLENALRLGSLIAGTPDEIALCVRPIGGSSDVDVEGSLTWREMS